MLVLVIGGTGTVGSQVIRRLAEEGVDVRVLTRSEARAGDLPAGTDVAIGDLSDPDTLGSAFEGADAVFLVTPLHPDETELGIHAVEAARIAAVPRIVHMTVHRCEEARHIPHFGSKLPIVHEIEKSGMGFTILEPNSFFQNDLYLREPILTMGLYPAPLGSAGVSRVDVRDIADAAVRALTGTGFEGERYPIVGPEPMTGPEVTATWGRHLGRDVRYAGDDLDAWERSAREILPDWMAHDLRIMWEHFQTEGLRATDDDLARCRRIVGHEPRAFDAFAAETAAAWQAG